MKLLWSILKILAVVMVALIAVAYLLPRDVTVERSVQIDAPAANVFPYVNAMQRTESWSPWLERDPDVELLYSGPEQGVGNRLEWSSEVDTVGSGSQEIIESVENKSVKTALDFGDMGTAHATFDLVEDNGKTNVTWGLHTDMGMNPMMRWMGLMFDSWVGADYEQGLANLKAEVEGQ